LPVPAEELKAFVPNLL